MNREWDAIIVGAGLFGVTAALELAARKRRVLLLDKAESILTGASFINQNRLHAGFHYPRSFLTALQCLDGQPELERHFAKCLRPCDGYYALAREGSLCTRDAYQAFLTRLRDERGVRFEALASPPDFLEQPAVEAAWRAYEPVLDMALVRAQLEAELEVSTVTLRLGVAAEQVVSASPYVVKTSDGEHRAPVLVNVAYAGLDWLRHPAMPALDLQRVEMVLVESDSPLPAVTVVDGPFCGILPFGMSRTLHWHYSVNHSVRRGAAGADVSNWDAMRDQASRYFSFMGSVKKVRSYFTDRVFLTDPETKRTDARPSVLFELEPGLFHIVSGKLATCFLVARQLAERVA